MQKRIICLALAALMLISVCGCTKVKDATSDTVSYITTYEDVYEDVVVEGEGSGSTGNSGTTAGGSGGGSGLGSDKTTDVGKNITVQEGTVTKGLDFGGKTFTKTIVGAIPAKTMRRKEAFEKKYNCKIKLVSLQWEAFNSQVATAMASGQPYDICGLADTHFPQCVIQGLYEPLNDYIYEDDIYNAKTGIGIDMNNSRRFEFKGKLYGVSDHDDVYVPFMQVMYYNKVMFEDAELEDPLKLWQQGKWDWTALEKIGKAVTNPSKGKYLMGQEFSMLTWVLSSGYNFLKTDSSGKVTHNLSDSLLITAANAGKKFRDAYVGPKGYSDDPTEFYNGNYYMFCQASSYGQYYMYDSIVASSAFENNFKNLGVVPFPLGPNNTEKAYPAHGGQAKAAGKGSGAEKLVIAWTKFASEFEDPERENDPTYYSAEIQAALNTAFNNVNNSIYNYSTSSNSAVSLTNEILSVAAQGGDITKAISERSNTLQSIIDSVLGQK